MTSASVLIVIGAIGRMTVIPVPSNGRGCVRPSGILLPYPFAKFRQRCKGGTDPQTALLVGLVAGAGSAVWHQHRKGAAVAFDNDTLARSRLVERLAEAFAQIHRGDRSHT